MEIKLLQKQQKKGFGTKESMQELFIEVLSSV